MKNMEGKTALVTGSASGIGKAIAVQLAKEGAKVVVSDSNIGSAQLVASLINETGGTAIAIKVDVSKDKEVTSMVDKATKALDSIDILVNAAGIFKVGTVLDISLETWEQVLGVNLTGTFLCCKAVLPGMIRKRKGSIINFSSSTGAYHATKNACAYVSSKGGVALLTKSMAIDYAMYNIRVNAICPGPTATPMLDNVAPEQLEALKQRIPIGRLAEQSEIAKVALFLASDDSSFVTGAMISVDGGQTAGI